MLRLSAISVRLFPTEPLPQCSRLNPVSSACTLTEIPKFPGRRSKSMAETRFAQFKLMATYAYGYGFTPFLVHNSHTCAIGCSLL